MGERRPLVAGIRPAEERVVEEAFVFGKTPEPIPANAPSPPTRTRVKLTTQVRADLAAALKRASLQRQLAGEAQSAVQEIVEAALEPWLHDRGYLP
jgi:hypothetical protein